MDITATIVEILSEPAVLPAIVGVVLHRLDRTLRWMLPAYSDRVNERMIRLAKAQRQRRK